MSLILFDTTYAVKPNCDITIEQYKKENNTIDIVLNDEQDIVEQIHAQAPGWQEDTYTCELNSEYLLDIFKSVCEQFNIELKVYDFLPDGTLHDVNEPYEIVPDEYAG